MENFKKLLSVAKKLELKYIVAQAPSFSAQPVEIETALKRAGLWELSNQISPLMDTAKVPSNASADIKLEVKPGPTVSFSALVDPTNPKAAQTLSMLLFKNFSNKMSNALKSAGVNVTDTIIVNWLKF